MNTQESYHDRIQVIPGFREIFGRTPILEELLEVVRHYPAMEWLSFLARFQNIFWGERASDPDQMRAVFFGALSQDLRDRIAQFAKTSGSGARLILFYERQISTLQQLAILHAPISGNRTFNDESGRHDLGLALLMTYDLMDLDRRKDRDMKDTLACVVQDCIRMAATPAERYAARALYFYDLKNDHPPAPISEFMQLYTAATGVNARDAILGGLCDLYREKTRDRKELANTWHAVPHPDKCENPQEAEVLRASAPVRWGDLKAIREAITQFDSERPMRDWNLIALSKFPIIDFGEPGAFVINHTALGRSLFDGVRHAVLTAAIEKRLSPPYSNPAAIGHLYGRIFEKYIADTLRTLLPHQVIVIPEGSEERCDLLIWYPDKVILIEVKAQHFLAAQHASYLTLAERSAELEQLGIGKAVEQIVSTIELLRNGTLLLDGMPPFMWFETPIIPIVLTEEVTPQAPHLWEELYASFDRPFEELRGAGPIGRLRFMSIDDLELVPEVQSSLDLATLLYRWASNPEYHELPWLAYLNITETPISRRFLNQRFYELGCVLADRLGLDASELRPAAR